jgi:hypothetical protein
MVELGGGTVLRALPAAAGGDVHIVLPENGSKKLSKAAASAKVRVPRGRRGLDGVGWGGWGGWALPQCPPRSGLRCCPQAKYGSGVVWMNWLLDSVSKGEFEIKKKAKHVI